MSADPKCPCCDQSLRWQLPGGIPDQDFEEDMIWCPGCGERLEVCVETKYSICHKPEERK